MTEENPYQSPAAAPLAEATPSSTDRNLLRVRRGLQLVLIGFLLELVGMLPELLVEGSFRSEAARPLVALTFAAQPLGGLLTIVGMILLVDAPVVPRAKSLLWMAIVSNVVVLAADFVGDDEVDVTPWDLVSLIAGVVSWITLLLFLRKLALHFDERGLARECIRLILCGIAGFASLALVFVSYWLAMLLLVGVGLYVTWRYLVLLHTLGMAVKRRIAAPV